MPSEVAFEFGPFEVRWYGITFALGILAGAWLASVEARRKGDNPDYAWQAIPVLLVTGLVGARLYHVVDNWGFYRDNPQDIPAIWEGGIGIFGAIAGILVGALLFAWCYKLPLPRWLDSGAPALLLGQAIGRWGNFFNQELFGPPTDLPWGIPIDRDNRPAKWINDERFHPLFLYEFLWNLAMMGLLLLVARRWGHRLREGDIALMYGIAYPAGRIWMETLRTDNWLVAGVPMAQIVSGATILACSLVLLYRHWGELARAAAVAS
jgi:phosphatidylglycerol:prolipoprotein diacylglycerol transferase